MNSPHSGPVLTPEQTAVAVAAKRNRLLRQQGDNRFVVGMCASPLFEQLWKIQLSNDQAALDTEAIRHHYVPKLTLKRFALEGPNQIGQLEIATETYVATSLDGAASTQRLYQSTFKDGESHNQIEGYLSIVDGHAAPAIERLLKAPTELNDADRATLSHYFALQMLRTPAVARTIEGISNVTFRATAGMLFSDLEVFAKVHEETHGEQLSGDELVAERDKVVDAIRNGRVRLSGSNGASFAEAIDIAGAMVAGLFDLSWIVLRSPGTFVTSDRAHAIYDPEPRSPWATQAPLGSAATEISIPLAPEACLMMRPGSSQVFDQHLVDGEAQHINRRTVAWAERFLYGASEDPLRAAIDYASRDELSHLRPRPQRQPHLIERDPDDDSIARENEQRGWPRTVFHNGVEFDYVVFDLDPPSPDEMERAEVLAKARAAKRLGLPIDSPELKPHFEVPNPGEIRLSEY